MRLTRIEAGTRLLGHFVGVSRGDDESQGHWIVEGSKAGSTWCPSLSGSPMGAARNGSGPATSRACGEWSLEPPKGKALTQPMRYGRLEEIEAVPMDTSILDLEVVRGLERSTTPAVSGRFCPRLCDAVPGGP